MSATLSDRNGGEDRRDARGLLPLISALLLLLAWMVIAGLALIAVLPEYAVDAVFAFQAGRDPVVAQAGHAVANMTGANRLLLGLGWSSVVLVAWWRRGARQAVLEPGQALELGVLLAGTLYGERPTGRASR